MRTLIGICVTTVLASVTSGTLAQQLPGQTMSPSQAAAATAAVSSAQPAPQDSQWVSAGAPPAPQPGQAQPAAGGGFPTPEAVIAPPAAGFDSAPNGPQNYGSGGNQATAGQAIGPNGQQTVIAPPVIKQARDVVSPFAPTEIRELHADFDETRKAKASQPVNTIPKISAVSVDLSPGSSPPLVRAARNEPSTVVFFDSTGAPWPLAAKPRVGSDDYFDVVWLKDTSAVVITAKSSYEQTGMVVLLKGSATPIVIKLTSGDPDSDAKTRIVDYRLDVRVPGRGPDAKVPVLGQGRIGMYDDVMQNFLDGTPPQDAKRIKIDGEAPSHTQVWQLGGSLYLRTPLDIRSAFEQTMSSGDGMHVFKLDPTPLIAVSQAGQNVSLILDIE